jgi:serine/threonine protein kinase
MESMEGGTIGRGGNLKAGPIANALLVKTLARHVACALQHFEAKRVVHRDIKGDNIMLGQGDALGQVKVVDFGEAVQLKSEAKLGKLQQLLHPVGTPGFMAPEVAYQYKDHELPVGTNVHICDIENEALDRHLLFDERRKTNSVVANSCFICNCTQARLPQVWSEQGFGHSAVETPLIHACSCVPLKWSQGQALQDETVFGHPFSAVRSVFAHELCMQKYAFYTALLVAPFDKWLGGVNLSSPRCDDCKCVKTDYALAKVMKGPSTKGDVYGSTNFTHILTCGPTGETEDGEPTGSTCRRGADGNFKDCYGIAAAMWKKVYDAQERASGVVGQREELDKLLQCPRCNTCGVVERSWRETKGMMRDDDTEQEKEDTKMLVGYYARRAMEKGGGGFAAPRVAWSESCNGIRGQILDGRTATLGGAESKRGPRLDGARGTEEHYLVQQASSKCDAGCECEPELLWVKKDNVRSERQQMQGYGNAADIWSFARVLLDLVVDLREPRPPTASGEEERDQCFLEQVMLDVGDGEWRRRAPRIHVCNDPLCDKSHIHCTCARGGRPWRSAARGTGARRRSSATSEVVERCQLCKEFKAVWQRRVTAAIADAAEAEAADAGGGGGAPAEEECVPFAFKAVERTEFLHFLDCCLRIRPEDRSSATALLQHDFLKRGLLKRDRQAVKTQGKRATRLLKGASAGEQMTEMRLAPDGLAYQGSLDILKRFIARRKRYENRRRNRPSMGAAARKRASSARTGTGTARTSAGTAAGVRTGGSAKRSVQNAMCAQFAPHLPHNHWLLPPPANHEAAGAARRRKAARARREERASSGGGEFAVRERRGERALSEGGESVLDEGSGYGLDEQCDEGEHLPVAVTPVRSLSTQASAAAVVPEGRTYVIEYGKRLGDGQNGDVFRARLKGEQENVAIKIVGLPRKEVGESERLGLPAVKLRDTCDGLLQHVVREQRSIFWDSEEEEEEEEEPCVEERAARGGSGARTPSRLAAAVRRASPSLRLGPSTPARGVGQRTPSRLAAAVRRASPSLRPGQSTPSRGRSSLAPRQSPR